MRRIGDCLMDAPDRATMLYGTIAIGGTNEGVFSDLDLVRLVDEYQEASAEERRLADCLTAMGLSVH